MKLNTILVVGAFILFMSSCTAPQTYYWGKYEETVYKHNNKQSEDTEEDLIEVYRDIIEKKNKGVRKEVPPGVYADLGFLLIANGDKKKGTEFLEKEMEIYPESKKIIEYVLSKL